MTIGCSNVLHCCEVWCSHRGGWWRGRPYKQAEQTHRLNRAPPHVASYSSFTLPRDETMLPCYMIDHLWSAHTGSTRRANLPPPPVKQICHGNIHSAAESVWEEEGERHVVNNRCETTCTSRHRPPLDNATTRWWGRARRPVQQTICNHTNLPVGWCIVRCGRSWVHIIDRCDKHMAGENSPLTHVMLK